jgi:hypothetical protein
VVCVLDWHHIAAQCGRILPVISIHDARISIACTAFERCSICEVAVKMLVVLVRIICNGLTQLQVREASI